MGARSGARTCTSRMCMRMRMCTCTRTCAEAAGVGTREQVDPFRVRLGGGQAAQELLAAAVLSGELMDLEEAIGVAEAVGIGRAQIADAQARLPGVKARKVRQGGSPSRFF